MKKIILALFFILLGGMSLYAQEPQAETSAWEDIMLLETRGYLNFLTSPGEFIRTPKLEKEAHPKAWPMTVIPKSIMNFLIRATSSIHDFIFFPWYVDIVKDTTPFTRRFDLPDYVWEEE